MSAFIQTAEHIHTLIHAGLSNTLGRLRWQASASASIHAGWTGPEPSAQNGVVPGWKFGEYLRELTRTSADTVGQMLLDANVANVNHVYEEGEVLAYTYRQPRRLDYTPAALLLAVDGYEYQCCDRAEWHESEAYEFCEALRRHLIRQVPGYAEADTWAIR